MKQQKKQHVDELYLMLLSAMAETPMINFVEFTNAVYRVDINRKRLCEIIDSLSDAALLSNDFESILDTYAANLEVNAMIAVDRSKSITTLEDVLNYR